MNVSIDHGVNVPRPVRSRVSGLCIGLLLLSCVVGAATLSEPSANYLDLAKIVAVAAFIGSMVALAVGMVGDAYRP